MVNKFIGSGRLTKDPDCRYTQTGKAVCTFNIAIDEGWGENKRTTFIPIIVWDKQGEACANNLCKGQAVLVEGRVQVRKYEKDGSARYATEIVAHHVEFGAKPKGASTNDEPPDEFGGSSVPDEDIPF